MPGFEESAITLDFPDSNFFRFQDCLGYKKLSGNHFKEMDACWFESEKNTYWLIELRDYSLSSIISGQNEKGINGIIYALLKKSVDCLCMLLASKHNYPYASNLDPCFFPKKPDDKTKFNLFSIIHCSDSQKPSVQFINEKYRNMFKPYAEIFGISSYTVIEHSRAISIIPYNIVK